MSRMFATAHQTVTASKNPGSLPRQKHPEAARPLLKSIMLNSPPGSFTMLPVIENFEAHRNSLGGVISRSYGNSRLYVALPKASNTAFYIREANTPGATGPVHSLQKIWTTD